MYIVGTINPQLFIEPFSNIQKLHKVLQSTKVKTNNVKVPLACLNKKIFKD